MRLYLKIVRFSFLRYLIYPLEIVSGVLKRGAEVLFLILFWSIYIKSSGINYSSNQLISYFLIAIGVGDLVMAKWGYFCHEIRHQIKDGSLNNNVIKPVNLLLLLYSNSVGKSGIKFIFSFVYIVLGLAISENLDPLLLIYFLLFLINAWAIGFAYNILEGSIAFYSTESGNINNTIQNTIAILTGSLIPLSFFPTTLQQIIRLTPFPSLVYAPSSILSLKLSQNEILINLLIGFFWAIALNLAAIKTWHHSIKKYEAIGI